MRHRYRRFWQRRVAEEIDDELRFHREMRIADLVARGMSQADAEREALTRLGDVGAVADVCRAIGYRQQRREARAAMFDSILHDLRLVGRSFTRQKGWSAVAVLTLALGIGANSALFTIVNAVLIRPLPYPASEQILSLSESYSGQDRQVVASPVYDAWLADSRSFSAIAAFAGHSAEMRVGDGTELVRGGLVTQGYFATLGVSPMFGRAFTIDEDRPGAARVVILSEQLWRRQLGADAAMLGRTIVLDGDPATVVGIMPASFTSERRAQYWLPYRLAPATGGVTYYYSVLARLRPGVTVAAAHAELSAIEKRVNAQRGSDAAAATTNVMTWHERRYGNTRSTLMLLFAAVGVLLLIACANVANLILARAARRRREFAARVALGASGWRLLRYLLSEGIVLSVAGAALALVIARLSVGWFVRISPDAIARTDDVHIDLVVVGFTMLVAVAAGMAFSLVPALDIRRSNISDVLTKGGVRSTNTRRQRLVRRILIVGEFATALMLLTSAGLVTKSFAIVSSIDGGIDPRSVLTGDIQLSRKRYRGDAPTAFYDALLARLDKAPGVARAAIADARPIGGRRMTTSFRLPNGAESPRFDVSGVSEGYFALLGVPMARGRAFQTTDRAGGAPVAILNETMARAVFGSSDPVGQTIPMHGEDGPRPTTVVGVARDVMQHGVEAVAPPMVYLPIRQDGLSNYETLIVRAAGDARSVQATVHEIIRSIDPLQPLPAMLTMEQVMADAVAPRRFTFVLLGLFAALAAVLAAVGQYGMMSYVVSERTNEIGIRVALGADRRRVMRLILGEGMRLTLTGLIIGFLASLAAVRALRTMLFQVSIYDPWIFAAAAVTLSVVALVACALPAFRATRVDPVSALASS